MGLLFKSNTSGTTAAVLFNFNSTNGSRPIYSSLLELMSASISVNNVGCTGQSLSAYVTGGGLGKYTYLWSTGETTDNITVSTAGAYHVKVENASHCFTNSANYNVSTAPITTVDAGSDVTFCTGSDGVQINAQSNVVDPELSWNPERV